MLRGEETPEQPQLEEKNVRCVFSIFPMSFINSRLLCRLIFGGVCGWNEKN